MIDVISEDDLRGTEATRSVKRARTLVVQERLTKVDNLDRFERGLDIYGVGGWSDEVSRHTSFQWLAVPSLNDSPFRGAEFLEEIFFAQGLHQRDLECYIAGMQI